MGADVNAIKVFDPNVSASVFADREASGDHVGKEIQIFRRNNRYLYLGAGDIRYDSDRGAQLYYVPWSLVDSLQHVPAGLDPLSAAIEMIIAGDSVDTVSLKDMKGNNLDARKAEKGESLKNKFFLFNLANSVLPPEVLVRKRAGEKSSFIHQLAGRKEGNLVYASRQGLTEFVLQTDIRKGEGFEIETRDLGSAKPYIKCTPQKTKAFQLTYFARQGTGREAIKFTLKNLPVEKEKALAFNLNPGVAGIDIVGISGKGATVEVENIASGKTIKKLFKLDGYTGVRLQSTSFAVDNKLTAAPIQAVNGAARGAKVLLAPED
jgi:hypothetical protein